MFHEDKGNNEWDLKGIIIFSRNKIRSRCFQGTCEHRDHILYFFILCLSITLATHLEIR